MDLNKMKERFCMGNNGFYHEYTSAAITNTTLDEVIRVAAEYGESAHNGFSCFSDGFEENGVVTFNACREHPVDIAAFFSEHLPDSVVYADMGWDYHIVTVYKNGEMYDGFTAKWEDGEPEGYYEDEEEEEDAILYYDCDVVLIDDETGYNFYTGGGMCYEEDFESFKNLIRHHPCREELERWVYMEMCFTGPRPKNLYGYDREKYLPLLNALKGIIRGFITQGYDTFVTGGAQGFDQLAFWAIHALKKEGYNIKNIVYVPFKGQERRWAKEGLFSQKEYNLMLKLADEVHILSDIDLDASNQGAISDAMYNRNHKMVDDTDATLGVFPDYSWRLPETKSGTAECMRYAKEQGNPIFQLSPETMKGQWLEGEENSRTER